MKTCLRPVGGNFHLRAALDRVSILTVFSGEDAMQQTALLPAQAALLLAQDRLLAGDPRDHEVVLPHLPGPALTPRWPTQPFSVSDCDVGTWEPAQEDAAAMATEGVEEWAESEQKGLFRYTTGSRCPCLLPCQCVRVRVCVRVFS